MSPPPSAVTLLGRAAPYKGTEHAVRLPDQETLGTEPALFWFWKVWYFCLQLWSDGMKLKEDLGKEEQGEDWECMRTVVAVAAVGTKAVVVEESIGDAAVGAKAVEGEEKIGGDAAAVEEGEDSGGKVRGREIGTG